MKYSRKCQQFLVFKEPLPCCRVKRSSYQGLDWESALWTGHIGTVWGKVQSHYSQSHSRPPASLMFPASVFVLSHWPFHAPMSGNVLFSINSHCAHTTWGIREMGSQQQQEYFKEGILCFHSLPVCFPLASPPFSPLHTGASPHLEGLMSGPWWTQELLPFPQRRHFPVQEIPEPQVPLSILHNYHLLAWIWNHLYHIALQERAIQVWTNPKAWSLH